MAYVILCREPTIEAYVLPDGASDLTAAQHLMQSRAEEFIDEQVELAVESDELPGNLCMEHTGTTLVIYPLVDNVRGGNIMEMDIQEVAIHG